MLPIPTPADNLPARSIVNHAGQSPALTILDSRVEILASNAATGGRAFIFIENSQPGGGPPLHKHTNEDEFFFILEGKYMFLIDGKQVTVSAGASLMAPAGSMHTFANMGSSVGRMLLVTVPCRADTPSTFEHAFEKTHQACAQNQASLENITSIFGAAGITFHGPPLAAMGLLAPHTS